MRINSGNQMDNSRRTVKPKYGPYLFTLLLERGRLTLVATPRKVNPLWLPCHWLIPTVNTYHGPWRSYLETAFSNKGLQALGKEALSAHEEGITECEDTLKLRQREPINVSHIDWIAPRAIINAA